METLTSGSAVEGWGNTLTARLEGAPCPYHNKTATTVGSVEVLDKWPVLIVCPGHMVWKWKREVEAASDPAAPIAARVITYPVRAESSHWSKLQAALEAAGGQVSQTQRWQVAAQTANDPGGRRSFTVQCAASALDGVLKVVSSLGFRGKDGSGKAVQIKPIVQITVDGVQVEYIDRDEYTVLDFITEYQSGLLGEKAAAICSHDQAKFDAGADPGFKLPKKWLRTWNEITEMWENVQEEVCPTCGQPVKPSWRFCQNKDAEKRTCNGALYQMSRWRRTGVAPLLNRKYKGLFKVYVADECHKAKSGKSDIGAADQRLIAATRHSLALTGTLFGGVGSSLFYLLYRRSYEVRQAYAFADLTGWVDDFGLWKRSWNQKQQPVVTGERGASTGIERWNYRQNELPGIGPGVIRYLLPITLFGNITDLGYELPPLYEDVELVQMADEQAAQYAQANEKLLEAALELLQAGDSGGISTWFNTIRFRPMSAFRFEKPTYVSSKIHKGGFTMPLPEVISASQPWLPKEQRLAEIVRRNLAHGKKTLVFAEQTGDRDIRERLKDALETLVPGGDLIDGHLALAPMPRVKILNTSVDPAKREAWIALNAPSTDVLIVNARLVETGLDLVMFSEIVFYETSISLYTLWQAMRRVWRLGQKNPVGVTFLCYANTVEESILTLMGQKKKAAQLLYGEEASGVLVESDGEDDIQREIIRRAIAGTALENAGEMAEKLFDGQNRPAPVPVVIPARQPEPAPVPVTITLETNAGSAVMQLSLFGEAVSVSNRKRRK